MNYNRFICKKEVIMPTITGTYIQAVDTGNNKIDTQIGRAHV